MALAVQAIGRKILFIIRNKKNLWEYNYVHRWGKPDHLSIEEFEAEEKLFKDTLEKEIYIEGEEEYIEGLKAKQSTNVVKIFD